MFLATDLTMCCLFQHTPRVHLRSSFARRNNVTPKYKSYIIFYFSVAEQNSGAARAIFRTFSEFFFVSIKISHDRCLLAKASSCRQVPDIICPFTSSWGQPGRLLALSGRRQELKQRKRFTFLAGLFFPALALGDFLVALGLATFAGEALAGLGAAALAGEAALGAAFARVACVGLYKVVINLPRASNPQLAHFW